MREDLDEGVLYGFVGVGWLAEVLIRDAEGAPLVQGDEVGEALAGGIAVTALQQFANFDRQTRVVTLRSHRVGQRGVQVRPVSRRYTVRPYAVQDAGLVTHWLITSRRGLCLQSTAVL